MKKINPLIIILFIIVYMIPYLNNVTIFAITDGFSSLRKKIIVLDPGHGISPNLEEEPISPGSSIMKIKDGGGASGVVTNTPEHEVNLKVALNLQKLLENGGYRVIMTKKDPKENLGNIERAEIGNKENADLVLRIHCDSYESEDAFGASMLVPMNINENTSKIYEKSTQYGKIILDTLCERVPIRNRGLIYTDQMTGFNWSKVPVVLVEMGFLSNPDEDRLLSLDAYQKKLAEGLFKGIEGCFKK